MLAITSFDISISGVIGIIRGFGRMTCGLIALSAGILAGLWGFRDGASIAGTLIEDAWRHPSGSRFLVGAVEQMDEKTGKWKPMPLDAGGERRSGILHLTPGDGELLKVVPVVKQ